MDLGLLLFGVIGMAYGLTSHETKSKNETPKLPDLPEGSHYEVKVDEKTGAPIPIVVPNNKGKNYD